MVASVARWAGVTLPTACLRLGTAKLENLGKENLRPMNRKAWWMMRTLERILTKELYTGTYYYRKVWKPRAVKRKDAKLRPEVDPIPMPRIVDDRLFRLAQLQLKKNSELSPRG